MEFLHNNRELFKEAIDLAVYQTGLLPETIEKDYYITMILRYLAENVSFIVFKGGTSLSKCHKVIKRFSEDIDLSVDISLSQGQKKKVKTAIVGITEKMGLEILNLDETRSRRDYNRYVIGYHSVLAAGDAVVQPAVLVETSYTTISFPTNILQVTNHIGDMLSLEAPEVAEKYNLIPFEIKVQGLDRTFVDKVFAVCDYYLQNNVKKHSRHIYDIYKLLSMVSLDEGLRELVAEVRATREKSRLCLSAQEGIDIPTLLKEIIGTAVYKADYKNLTEGLLEEKVSYETAIIALEKIIVSKVF